MRINQLNLWRYGKFTDFNLDFGSPQSGKADLHIVYGPNEAGKTTLMSAYLDFLFGFPGARAKTEHYNFQHDNNALKIGAILTIDNETIDLRRVKKTKNNLLDSNDQTISEGKLQQQLASLSKTSYANMFSLNDVTLKEGGESILASEGDLGQLLYAATTGVAQLSDALIRMRANNNLFYEQGKRKFELAELKKRLKLLDAERKSIDTEATAYAKLVRQRDLDEQAYFSLGNEHDKIKLQIKKLQLDKSAYPHLRALERLHTEMIPLASLPEASLEWTNEVRQLKTDNIKTDTTKQNLINDIALIDEQINTIVIDEAAQQANTQWQQSVIEREKYATASSNLPELQQQARKCRNDIAACLQKMERSDTNEPSTLVLNATTQANLKELIRQHPDVIAQLNAAKKELLNAESLHTENQTRFEQQGGNTDVTSEPAKLDNDAHAINELELSIAPHAGGELTAQYRATLQTTLSLEDDLDEKLALLSPWTGDASALLAMQPPHSSELASFLRRRDDLNNQHREKHLSLVSSQEKLDDIESQQQSFTSTGLIDDTESSKLRSFRDEAWQAHRQSLDSQTADTFERAMRADDASQATRLAHTESLAQLGQLTRDALTTNNTIKRTKEIVDGIEQEQKALNVEFQNSIKALSPQLNTSMSIEALTTWLKARNDALQVSKELTQTKRSLSNIDSQATNACKTVLSSLQRAGISNANNNNNDNDLTIDTLSSLINTANNAIKKESAIKGLRDQLLSSQNQLNARQSALKDAQNSLEQWTNAWQQVCEICWLGSKDTNPNPVVIEETLQQLVTLEHQIGLQSGIQDKIIQQEGIVTSFSQSLIAVANALDIPHENASPDQLYQTLLTRMNEAAALSESHKVATSSKKELLKQQKTNQENHKVVQAAIDAKNVYFSVTSIDDVEIKLQDVTKKQELQKRIDHEQNELLKLLEVQKLDEAKERLSHFNSDAADTQLGELERSANDIEIQLREAHTASTDSRRAVENVGGDETVALLNEQRANLLVEIEDKISNFLQQHLALNAADKALKTYRDNHRSSMIIKASEAFAHISQGRYLRLETSQDGANEQLIAIEKGGRSKMSDELSKGTLFQLYLALRVAGFHEYVRTHPPVPFIADDIMETSDDERAKRTFDVLGDMAMAGQVIYLTHHEHLCKLAKQAVPDCTIHTLPTTMTT